MTISFGSGVTGVNWCALSGCYDLHTIHVNPGNPYICSENDNTLYCIMNEAGYTAVKDGNLVKYASANNASSLMLREDCTGTVIYALDYISKLKKIYMPETVKVIGKTMINVKPIIYGKTGTTAKTYAINNGMTFVETLNK